MKAFDPDCKLLDEMYQEDLEWFNIPIDAEEAIRERDW